ncbi:MAG: hypothetical protein KDB03_12970 [Planctomycetales bacterium]|nr:hypothetical protein [Planctomycetales bacterium]
MAFCKDSKSVFVGTNDGFLYLWKPEQPFTECQSVLFPPDAVFCDALQYSVNEELLAGFNRQMLVPIANIHDHALHWDELAIVRSIDPLGKNVFIASQRQPYLSKIDSEGVFTSLEVDTPPDALCHSPDGKWLFVGKGHRLQLISTNDGSLAKELIVDKQVQILQQVASATDSSGRPVFYFNQRNSIGRWAPLSDQYSSVVSSGGSLAVTNDGETLVELGADRLRIFRARDLELLAENEVSSHVDLTFEQVQVIGADRLIARTMNALIVFDLYDGNELFSFPVKDLGPFGVSKDGALMSMAVSQGQSGRIYEVVLTKFK